MNSASTISEKLTEADVECLTQSLPERPVTERATEAEVVGQQTATGVSWAVGARIISRVIDLITMVVLAHLLHPGDFGLVAIAMTVIYVIEAALELPIGHAMVRLDVIRAGHYDTAFTLGVLRGALLSVMVCAISYPFAVFFGDLRLIPLVCALSLAPVSRGLVSPRLADFTKKFNFVPDFTMEFVGKLSAFTVAITLAFTTHSYWAIAVGTLIAPAAGTVISYFVAPYKPTLSLRELPAFSGFLGWITAAQVVSSLNWQADRLLLGKLTSRSALGLFTAANDTSNIPIAALLTPIMRPLLSAFTVLREHPVRLARSYQSSASAVITIALPILIGESLIAEPFVRLMFGEKWIGSAVYLRWLALSLIPTLFAVPLGPLVMAFGKTEIFFKRNLFEICVKLPLILIGALRFGFIGVVLARGISETVTACFCMLIVRKLIGVSLRDQIFTAWRSFVSAGVMAGVLYIVLPPLTHTTQTLALAGGTLLAILVAATVYCSLIFGLWTAFGCPHGIETIVRERLRMLLRVRKSLHLEVSL